MSRKSDAIELMKRVMSGDSYLTYKEIAKITGYHEKYLLKLKKDLEAGTISLVHGNTNRKPKNTITQEERENFVVNIATDISDSVKIDEQIMNFFGSGFKEEDYVFLIGFNQSEYPKTYKDEDYLTDIEKYVGLGFRSFNEINRLYKITTLPESSPELLKALVGNFLMAFRDTTPLAMICDIILACPVMLFFEAIWTIIAKKNPTQSVQFIALL